MPSSSALKILKPEGAMVIRNVAIYLQIDTA